MGERGVEGVCCMSVDSVMLLRLGWANASKQKQFTATVKSMSQFKTRSFA